MMGALFLKWEHIPYAKKFMLNYNFLIFNLYTNYCIILMNNSNLLVVIIVNYLYFSLE